MLKSFVADQMGTVVWVVRGECTAEAQPNEPETEGWKIVEMDNVEAKEAEHIAEL